MTVFQGFQATPPQLIGGEKLSSAQKLSLKLRILDKREPDATSSAQGSERHDLPLMPAHVPEILLIPELPPKPAVCGWDYITVTGWVADRFERSVVGGVEIENPIPSLPKTLEYFQFLVAAYWSDSSEFLDDDAYLIRGYNRAISYYSGRIKICWAVNNIDDSPKIHQKCYFSVTGSLLEQLDQHKQCDLLRGLFLDFDMNCTRGDVFVRDENYLLTPKELKVWADAGHLCRFRHKNFRYIEDGIKGETGSTFYAGRRTKNGVSGGCLYRCYDEALEPRSPVKAIKHEVEWSGEKVKSLIVRFKEFLLNHFDTLTGKVDEAAFAQFCLESTVGAGVIDFREGVHTNTLDSRKRVSAWAAFVEGIAKIRIQGKVKKPELDAFPITAFVHQWGRKLAKESNKDARYLVEAFLNTISSNLADIISKAIKVGEEKLNIRKGQRLFNNEVANYGSDQAFQV